MKDQGCHADVLLDMANEKKEPTGQTSVTLLPYKETADYVKGNRPESEVPLEFIDDGLEVCEMAFEPGDGSAVTREGLGSKRAAGEMTNERRL